MEKTESPGEAEEGFKFVCVGSGGGAAARRRGRVTSLGWWGIL